MYNVTFKETIQWIKEDLRGYAMPFWRAFLVVPGFKYSFHHRLCYYFYCHKWLFPMFVIWRLYMYHLTYKFGIQTAWNKPLPRYISLPHFSGITFFPESCGHHLYLRQGCTVGRADSEGTGRLPRIGNYVEFGANVCVIGDIEIGNNVKIGAGAVVTKSVPDNSVVVGIPAKVVKHLEPLDEALYQI